MKFRTAFNLAVVFCCSLCFSQQIDYVTQIKNKPAQVGGPSAGDHIQFVSPFGNDSNDGLSWATAKFTCNAAKAAIGSNIGIIYESPALIATCIAGTGSATGLNGYIYTPSTTYFGPTAQATALTTGVDSSHLRLSGSVWNGSIPVDDFWEIFVNSFSGAFSDGSNLISQHSSVEGGSGRWLMLHDLVIGNPRDATALLNSNSFAFDNQGAYFESGSQAMLWEMANTASCDGCALGSTIFRQNWVPIFNSACAGCQAEYALGGSGTLGVSGNYSGPPKWLFTNLRGGSFNTVTFTHSATAPRTFTVVDANSNSIVPLAAPGSDHKWVFYVDNAGVQNRTQPSCADLTVPCITSVTAHNLLSATHGDTVTHTVVRGDLIAGIGASPAWTAVAKGGTNTYPKWNSSGDVVPSTLAASGVGSCGLHQFETADNADTAPTCNQPAFTDISGTATASQVTAPGSLGQIVFNNTTLGADSNLQWDNTNKRLGIGQATPLEPLHIKTTASGGWPQNEIENGAAGGSNWFFGGTDTGNGAGGGKFLIHHTNSSSGSEFTIDSATSNVGISNTSPAVELDVTGKINASVGFRVNGGATSAHVLRGNGTNFVDAALAAADLSNGTSGSGSVALVTSPSFTTPTIGAASATSVQIGNVLQQVDTGRFGANAIRFTSTAANTFAAITLMPSGSSTESDIRLYNASDPANTGLVDWDLVGTALTLTAGNFGTGTAPTKVTFSGFTTCVGGTGTCFSQDSAGVMDLGTGAASAKDGTLQTKVVTLTGIAFASLPASTNGSIVFCSDCNATCTAGGGTGRTCFRENGAWTH